jgi:hypothetical protein
MGSSPNQNEDQEVQQELERLRKDVTSASQDEKKTMQHRIAELEKMQAQAQKEPTDR